MPEPELLGELRWRGLVYQETEGLSTALARGPVSAYVGFDPTAPSLHVGNLVPVMALVHLQRHGGRPIVLVGGGTGLIGDPSGKASERPLSDSSTVQENARRIRAQLERFVSRNGSNAARVHDNVEWLLPLRAVDFMRDVGKHFTVNYMIAKESVKGRMEAGISFTEFAYMLLQAYDYLRLNELEGATLQMGGSDQWGNITAGIELIRRVAGKEAHGLTVPLVTTAAGTKFGKTEAGSVWLDPERTSPYRFYQFWIQTDDRDVGRYLRFFTLLDRGRIEELDERVKAAPQLREAQQALAADVTSRVHGADVARTAAEISGLLFGSLEPGSLSLAALEALRAEVPYVEVPKGSALDVIELLVASKLAASKGAARRLLQQGGVYVNGERVSAESPIIPASALLHGRYLLLRKGSRDYALIGIAQRS
jgi:tyrosyl-tRNA synthetase